MKEFEARHRRVTLEPQKLDSILFGSFQSQTNSIDSDDIEADLRVRKLIQRALKEVLTQELSDKQKSYLLEYYYKRTKMQDIADIYNVNVSTVSRTIARGRKKIFDRLKYLMELRHG